MKELKTFTTGKGTYDSFPDKTARSELPKKLTRPATAQVGDYLRIKAIGADGTMEVEAVPAPTGGSVTIPTKVSAFENDAGYVDEQRVQELLAEFPSFDIQVVQELPAVGEEKTIYLVPFASEDGQYLEYLYVGGSWEVVGSGKNSGDNVNQMEPAEDDIPKVFFGGALQQTKDEAVVPFRYISKTQDISGYAEIKAQGNSSMNYPKKNQTVKLFKDAGCIEKLKVDFKGWGKQNKHCYKANWIDLSHARNVVSARLWADVVKSRADYAELPELLRTSPNQGVVDGFPIKVYAAGVYQGRYTLNIPKDKWMANMDDELDTHCILCGENYVSGCFRAAANINGNDWTDEIHDTVPESIKTRWNEVISFVMNSTDDDFRANLNQYFYVDSLIDYYLFGLASCGLDAFGKNQIYATYDGQRWIAQMYDMDSTWGLYWNGSKFVSASYGRDEYEDYVHTDGNLLYNRLEQLFWSELQTRWAELKNGALSIENIINRFERFTDITPAEMVKEDYASTTGAGNFTGIPSQTTNNIQQIRAFALARQAWTDEYVAELTPEEAVPCTGITLSASELTFTEVGTQTLVATVEPENTTDTITWESNNTSVATVSGGVVTAVGNGEATITAKCGDYSATCAVAVSGIRDEVDDGVDYTLNPLNGVSWLSGQTYDKKTTGNVVSSTTDIASEKFTLQNCAYILHPASHQWAAILIWNENDEYVGFVGNQTTTNDIFFVAKSNYKYAIVVFGTTVDSGLTLMPKNNTATGVYSFMVDVSNVTVVAGNSCVDITGGELLPGVTNYADEIANSNYFIFHIQDMSASNYRGTGSVMELKEPLLCLTWFNNGTGNICTKFFGTDADAAKAWFAENGNLIVNAGY